MIIAEQKPCVEIMELSGDLGRLDQLMKIQSAKDWATSRDGGPRKIVLWDLLGKQQEGHHHSGSRDKRKEDVLCGDPLGVLIRKDAYGSSCWRIRRI